MEAATSSSSKAQTFRDQGQLSPQKRQPAVLYRQLSCLSLCRILVNLPTTHTTHLLLFHRLSNLPHPDTHTHRKNVVKPNARDHGDAPRVHQGRHSIHQPLHVCLTTATSPSSSGIHLLIVSQTVSPTSANFSRSARPSVSVSSSWALSVTLSS
jgi:hypothetical protein